MKLERSINTMVTSNIVTNGIKSKERVNEFGEVFTPKHIVLDMINLIPDETKNDINSTWLEPACGTGNFLVEIVDLKLGLASSSTGLDEYNINVIKSISTVYGIDIQLDNVNESKHRMLELVTIRYKEKTGNEITSDLFKSVKHILDTNIMYGNALTNEFMGIADIEEKKLRIAEWNFHGNNITRKDYYLAEMAGTLKAEAAYEYESVNYLNVADAQQTMSPFDGGDWL